MTRSKRNHRRLYRRLWLNKPHHESTASILTEVNYAQDSLDPASWNRGSPGAAISTTFSLSDCTRKVELDFDADVAVRRGIADPDNLAHLANVEHKARVLQSEVFRFTECVLSACQDVRNHAQALVVAWDENEDKINSEISP